ncbi:hypothetical protein LUZ62_076735 [Rhynchospora pubera]|uniref:VWFA domain-containing protein n=1 Tax=Rhynchospora pubera TaxID=906938 RepID=A0AAV8DEM3_9POAL|nr:hypothetical protein LUZ62_076735 [Rhynchospora pubera]
MRFDDDEPIVLPRPRGIKPIVPGRVSLTIENNYIVPTNECTVKALLLFYGSEARRAPVDIVAILQVSASMTQGKKLDEVKRAVLFVMSKLTPRDRLSIVVFSSCATRLYPLSLVTPSSKTELEKLINGLQAGGGTNMEDGLRMGLDILKNSKCTGERVAAIMFMSDGMQTHGDACNVEVRNVTVHTFGLGDEHDPKVLKAVANQSRGGTYSDCRSGNLTFGFAQCLGRLLSVVAQDLTFVSYFCTDDDGDPATTRLGDICINECRKVLIEIQLPPGRQRGTDVLQVFFRYKFEGEIYEQNPVLITVRRTVEATQQTLPTLPDVRAEEICRRIDRTRVCFDGDDRMSFDDDEQIVVPPEPKPIVPGRVKLVIRNNDKVPMDDNTQKVLLTFTGEENSRSPVDIVGVLDVSASMEDDDRLEELKKAMLFVVSKLSPVDRLSIVKYSTNAKRLCPLRLVTPSFKTELENLINGLEAVGGTNMAKGLCMGLDILKYRKCSRGRVAAIIFMSDGMQTSDDACNVEVGDVTVHTFGFGDEHDPKVLKAIADHSRGGTYSDFRLGNLSLGFAQCLGGLLSVVAQDLTMVLHLPDEESCNYRSQVWRLSTTRLGDLCIKECRKVLMEVHLPRGLTNILKVSYKYKFDGEKYESDPLTISVQRTVEMTAEQQQMLPDVRAEDIRLRIVRIMKQATADADNYQLENAQDKLIRGIKSPTGFSKEEVGVSSSKQKEDVGALWAQLNGELKYDLRAQLEELLELMKSEEIYKWEGRAFAYSLLSSHNAQKPAGRGYNMEKFATPQMYDFLLEAAGLDVKS